MLSSSSPPPPSNIFECKWTECHLIFESPSLLFQHLTEEHIKRRNQVCLKCHWLNCGYEAQKRDHIVSHVRVHVPDFKPFLCYECRKPFSRMQDLRKHWRVHDSSQKDEGNDREKRKLDHDQVLIEFVQDVQMKRVKPCYDDHMASMLTSLHNHLDSTDSLMLFDINEYQNQTSIVNDDEMPSVDSMQLDLFLEELYLDIQDQNQEQDNNLDTDEDEMMLRYLDYETGDKHQRTEAMKRILNEPIKHDESNEPKSYPSTLIRSLTLKQSNETPDKTSKTMDRNTVNEVKMTRWKHLKTIKLIMERLQHEWNRWKQQQELK